MSGGFLNYPYTTAPGYDTDTARAWAAAAAAQGGLTSLHTTALGEKTIFIDQNNNIKYLKVFIQYIKIQPNLPHSINNKPSMANQTIQHIISLQVLLVTVSQYSYDGLPYSSDSRTVAPRTVTFCDFFRTDQTFSRFWLTMHIP